jgi:hypothetical protein
LLRPSQPDPPPLCRPHVRRLPPYPRAAQAGKATTTLPMALSSLSPSHRRAALRPSSESAAAAPSGLATNGAAAHECLLHLHERCPYVSRRPPQGIPEAPMLSRGRAASLTTAASDHELVPFPPLRAPHRSHAPL